MEQTDGNANWLAEERPDTKPTMTPRTAVTCDPLVLPQLEGLSIREDDDRVKEEKIEPLDKLSFEKLAAVIKETLKDHDACQKPPSHCQPTYTAATPPGLLTLPPWRRYGVGYEEEADGLVSGIDDKNLRAWKPWPHQLPPPPTRSPPPGTKATNTPSAWKLEPEGLHESRGAYWKSNHSCNTKLMEKVVLRPLKLRSIRKLKAFQFYVVRKNRRDAGSAEDLLHRYYCFSKLIKDRQAQMEKRTKELLGDETPHRKCYRGYGCHTPSVLPSSDGKSSAESTKKPSEDKTSKNVEATADASSRTGAPSADSVKTDLQFSKSISDTMKKHEELWRDFYMQAERRQTAMYPSFYSTDHQRKLRVCDPHYTTRSAPYTDKHALYSTDGRHSLCCHKPCTKKPTNDVEKLAKELRSLRVESDPQPSSHGTGNSKTSEAASNANHPGQTRA